LEVIPPDETETFKKAAELLLGGQHTVREQIGKPAVEPSRIEDIPS
jgi:hypothetical protein